MKALSLVFPHQLFEENPILKQGRAVYVVEEWLFFREFNFHQQKLAHQRASCRFYADYLRGQGLEVHYVEAWEAEADVRILLPSLAERGYEAVYVNRPEDDWLEGRLEAGVRAKGLRLYYEDSPSFLQSYEAVLAYGEGRKRFFQTSFYTDLRKQKGYLLEEGGKPRGGKWTYDGENRKAYPKGLEPPKTVFPQPNVYWLEAFDYVKKHFSNHLGSLNPKACYPCTFEQAEAWLRRFILERFAGFGPYEDAMLAGGGILHHSVLSPLINNGLISPERVLEAILAEEKRVELPSVEGFVRQVLGWREFIRAMYRLRGRRQRSCNFWGFERKLSDKFYRGETGLSPFDGCVRQVLDTAYCHHIERLMILGNLMLLCEVEPDEVYRWFMELFIDAYDWVMVPNVYGMSQFADGGLLATKPYLSGSNYLMKMGNFKKGPWQGIWDGLFWRFMHKHRVFFAGQPRLGMLLGTWDKMGQAKREAHLNQAERFLESL